MNRLWMGISSVAWALVVWPAAAMDTNRTPGLVHPVAQKPVHRAIQVPPQKLTGEDIRRALDRSVSAQLDEGIGEIRIRVVEPREAVSIPQGKVDLTVTAGEGDKELGRRSFQVGIAVGGRLVETLDVLADVEAITELVVPIRSIQVDEAIQPEDVIVKRTAMTTAIDEFAKSPDVVVGKRALKPLRALAPIRQNSLGFVYAVRKGDRVTIEARRGGLLITATGVTKAGGQMGQSIPVTNQDSGKEIRGRVVGPGVVRVEF
jgi:flagella basal body P-ring formation protein FlgA